LLWIRGKFYLQCLLRITIVEQCYSQCQILRRIPAIPLSPKGGSILAERL
jgi:hypothetical protein